MATDISCDDLLPAYTLGILDEDEAADMAAHVRVCDYCQANITAYEALVADLALLAEEVAPSPKVKDRLMQRIRTTSARPLKTTDVMRWLRPLWKPALAFAILLLVAGNIVWFVRWNGLRTTALGDFRRVELAGSEAAPQASGLIIMSEDGAHGTLIVQHLPTLAESQAYQLWLIEDNTRVSGGVFGVSDDGYSNMWIRSERPLSDYDAFGVTIEPEEGSEGPTGENVLIGSR